MHQDPVHQRKAVSPESASPESEGKNKSLTPPAFQLKASEGPATPPPAQLKQSSGGMPSDLVQGFAATTGHDLSDVNVVRNSDKPAQVGALAFAQGNDIHLAPGQEQHLAHEAGHIVQQREGQVQANTQVNGKPVNDQQHLETAATEMGEKAMQMKAAKPSTVVKNGQTNGALQRQVIQKKDVPTDFGTFKTTKFEKKGERGVDIVLKFDPDETKVDATKIGLAQSVKITNSDGSHTGIDPAKESRRVTGGKGADYVHDRLSDKNNPIYGAENLNAGEGLDKTVKDNNGTADVTEVGKNATYQLGYAYKDGDATKKQEAGLWDTPVGGNGNMFESTALGLEGTDKDKYFGSVKWGYEVKAGKVEIQDIELVSAGNPSENFTESAKMWNTSKVRGTMEVIADPASAFDEAQRKWVDVPKGTKSRQLERVGSIGGVGVVEAELLDAQNAPTGKVLFIKVADLKDTGDGGDTVDLPIPVEQKAKP